MNIYKRPLFRQMGGPAQPMPQDVLAAGQQEGEAAGQMLMQSEVGLQQETLAPGIEYAQQTMQGLDAAEDFKQVIDSVRGNELPIQSRYEELAQYVGPEDAQSTPESVLAMVQPTLMMTEEGAMNSGVGELMQGLAGQVEMETATGDPTQMGQGLGSLMTAGQPVQQFNQGGAVRRYAPGGEVINLPTLAQSNAPTISSIGSTFQDKYKDRLAVYQQALGRDPQKEKEQMQADILFDIAGRGLAFASGVDPQTGENIADRPMGAQLARQVQTLPGTLSERLMQQRERKEGIELAALQSAETAEGAAFKQAADERAQRFAVASDIYRQNTAQSFQKGENEDDRSHQARLAKAERDLKLQLQRLEAANTQEQINLRGDIEARLKELQGEIDSGQIRLTHSNNMSMQGAKTADQIKIITKQAGLDTDKGVTLINAQGKVDLGNIKARGMVENELQSARLAHDVSQNALDRIENRLTVDTQAGVQIRGQDIQRAISTESTEAQKQIAEWNNENRLKLSDREKELQLKLQDNRQAFDTVQNELNRELQKGLANQDDERIRFLEGEKNRLQMELQNDQQEWLTGESDLDRKVKYAYLDADLRKAFFDRQLAYKSLQTEQDIASLRAEVDREKARIARFGSGMEGVANEALSSPAVLRAWANGELDEQSEQLIRQAIMDYAGPKTEEDASGNIVRKPARPLTPEVTELLIYAAPDLYEALYKESEGFKTPFLFDPSKEQAPSEEIAALDPVAAEANLPIYGRVRKDGTYDNLGIAPMSNAMFPIPLSQIGLEDSVGFRGAFTNFTNKAADLFETGNVDEKAMFGRQILTKLQSQLTVLPEAAVAGRPSVFLLETFAKLIPEPERLFTGSTETAAEIRTLLGTALSLEKTAALSLNNDAVGAKARQEAVQTINSIRPMITTLAALEQASRKYLDTPSPYVGHYTDRLGDAEAAEASPGVFGNYFR